jgi:hypothetical protein
MAAPPAPNRTPSCRPAVPPPPVSGAVVGNGRVDGTAVCVLAGCVAAVCVGCGVDDGRDPDGVRDACGVDDACDADGLPDAEAGAEARAEVLTPGEVALDLAEEALVDPSPVGDGVRVPGCVSDEADVCGVGVKMVGVADPPPPIHPDTVTASSAAPAAERPAKSHPVCASGMVRRIFMNPPLI